MTLYFLLILSAILCAVVSIFEGDSIMWFVSIVVMPFFSLGVGIAFLLSSPWAGGPQPLLLLAVIASTSSAVQINHFNWFAPRLWMLIGTLLIIVGCLLKYQLN